MSDQDKLKTYKEAIIANGLYLSAKYINRRLKNCEIPPEKYIEHMRLLLTIAETELQKVREK